MWVALMFMYAPNMLLCQGAAVTQQNFTDIEEIAEWKEFASQLEESVMKLSDRRLSRAAQL